MNSRVSTPLLVLGLAAAYFCVLGIIKLPYAEIPDWWLNRSPSRHIGVTFWLELLDVAGALLAALPVAVVLIWRLPLNYPRWAFVIAAPTALYSAVSLNGAPRGGAGRLDVLSVLVVAAVARLLAVPALALAVAWLMRRLRLTIVGAGRDR